MDPMDSESIDPPELVSDGGNRMSENGEEVRLRKKARVSCGSIKQVAEIVLVLSAMGKMRGGRSPSAAEKEIMAEAREKLAEMCQELAPKDILPMEAVGTVIEDLGLSRLKDQRLGFRPPKLSIADKLLITKRKMEESKEFAARTTSFSSQRLQSGFGPLAEGRGPSPTLHMLQSDNPSHATVSSGGAQPALPLPSVSAATLTHLAYPSPTNEIRSSAVVSSGLHATPLGRDSSPLALPSDDKAHFRLDGRSNGSSASQVRANVSGDHLLARAPVWSLQPQSTPSSRSENKLPEHSSSRVGGTPDSSVLLVAAQARDQTYKPFITQTMPGNLPSLHQPLPGANLVQAPLYNNHIEIGKIVQRLLHPQLPEHPTWTPPSRDYMNKAMTCQICKLMINEVDNVLICDACEKGHHLKCLHSYNQKSVLNKLEWHCPKCLHISHGKPLPPKYGRVMRNVGVPKMNIAGIQTSAEKKLGALDQKVNHQKITANGNSVLQGSLHIVSHSNMPKPKEMQGSDKISNRKKMDDKPCSETSVNNSIQTVKDEAASVAPSIDVPGEKSSQDVQISESSLHEARSASASKAEPSAETSDKVVSPSVHQRASSNPLDVDRAGISHSAEVPSKEYPENNHMLMESATSNINIDSNPICDIRRDDEDAAEAACPVATSGLNGRDGEHAKTSDGLHTVDWIGGILQVIDERTHYQSCSIYGVAYKVQDHALFRSSNGKLIPSKLQAMWEDNKSGSKWVLANRCYFPGDLPEVTGRPSCPEDNEVYESNHDSTVLAGLIQGPCEVLPSSKFKEESEGRSHLEIDSVSRLRPIFQCRWFYDESKGIFRPVTS